MVTIAHEWFTTYGGAERVLDAMLEIWPSAGIVAAYGETANYRESTIRYSPINALYRRDLDFLKFRLLSPLAFLALPTIADELIVSNGHSGSLWLRMAKESTWVHYCNTPARFIWRPDLLTHTGNKIDCRYLLASRLYKKFDGLKAQRPTVMLANSTWIRRRIQHCYGIDARVLYPPVDTDWFYPANSGQRDDYFLIVSRLETYKKVHQVMAAFAGSPWRLLVVGQGAGATQLREVARDTAQIEFLGHVSDTELRALYCRAIGLIVPGEEDFCIAAVEAMSCGTPVIGLRGSGLRDSVIPHQTGYLIDEMEVATLKRACSEVASRSWDSQALQSHASRFSKQAFQMKLVSICAEAGKEFGGARA